MAEESRNRFVSFPTEDNRPVAIDVTRVIKITPSTRRLHQCHLKLDTGEVITVDVEMNEAMEKLNG